MTCFKTTQSPQEMAMNATWDNLQDCCCFVELDNDSAASLHICGTTDGAGACSATQGSCVGSISGGGQFISLSTGNPKQIFCMDVGTAIRILNTSGSDNAGIRVGCNVVSTQAIPYTITPGNIAKANTDGDCVLTDCTN